MLVMNLDIAGISALSGSACSAGIEENSHVLVAIGLQSGRRLDFHFHLSIQKTKYTTL